MGAETAAVPGDALAGMVKEEELATETPMDEGVVEEQTASVLEEGDTPMETSEAGTSEAPAKGSLEDVLYGDPSKLTEPVKTIDDKWKLLPAFLKVLIPLRLSLPPHTVPVPLPSSWQTGPPGHGCYFIWWVAAVSFYAAALHHLP